MLDSLSYTQSIALLTAFEKNHMRHVALRDQSVWLASRQSLAGMLSGTSFKSSRVDTLHTYVHAFKWSMCAFGVKNHSHWSKADILVMDSVRGIDPDTRLHTLDTENRDVSYLWVAHPYHMSTSHISRYAQQSKVLGRSFSTFVRTKITRLRKDLEQLALAFCDHLRNEGIHAHALSINNILRHQDASIEGYRATLSGIDFQSFRHAWVYCYYSAATQALMQALQINKNINIVEFQHGMISSHHAGYGLDESVFSPSLIPKAFACWGKDWLGLFDAQKPFLQRRICVMGHPFTFSSSSIQPNAKRVLITSQRSLGDDFNRFVDAYVRNHTDHQFVLKPHPADAAGRRSFFQSLCHLEHVSMAPPNVSTLALLEGVSHHLSVYSTVLYEANQMGVINLIPKDVARSEISQPLVNMQGATYIEVDSQPGKVAPQKRLELYIPFAGMDHCRPMEKY